MDDARFVFCSQWHLDVTPRATFDALADADSYPAWWPQVRSAQRLDDTSGELRCRSLLPYELVFVVHREIEDRAGGILRGRVAGDLSGWSQWTVTADAEGTSAVFDEDVVVEKSLVRAAGRIARPLLRLNHDRMMRAGERGLRRHLAGADLHAPLRPWAPGTMKIRGR
ncbi:MAG: SRPBCC family protein [Jatrophihabitantaceae bacterium]